MKVYGIFLSRFPLFSHLRPSSSLPSTRRRIREEKWTRQDLSSVERELKRELSLLFLFITHYHRVIKLASR